MKRQQKDCDASSGEAIAAQNDAIPTSKQQGASWKEGGAQLPQAIIPDVEEEVNKTPRSPRMEWTRGEHRTD
jgi:hypothetical protein